VPFSHDWSVFASRAQALIADEITELLRHGSVEFVIADVGQPLRWVTPSDCFQFWKTEGVTHFAEPNGQSHYMTSWAGRPENLARLGCDGRQGPR
jgi:hypothetical protein